MTNEPIEQTAVNSQRNESDARLERCPRCTYNLQGLPVHYHCPECGLEIDRRWEIFGGLLNSKARSPIRGGLTGFVLFWAVWPLITMISGTGIYKQLMPAHLFMGVVLALLIWLTRRRPRFFVAVGPDNVVICRNRGIDGRHPLKHIKEASSSLFTGSITMELADGNGRVSHSSFFGLTVNEADRCAAAINRHVRSGA